MTRSISAIARDISRAWNKPTYSAVPYLQAMRELETVNDNYGYDTGRSVVLYFLSNAASFHGSAAKALKAELKAMLKG
jgi:hypothetical protein